MMKFGAVIPYLKKIQNIYESRDTPLNFCWHQHFFIGNQRFLYMKKYRYRLPFSTEFLILLACLESLKICFINLVIILMLLAEMATPGLFKITVFWNKGYDVIISVDGASNKILSRDSNYIVDVFVWAKFGNCCISIREVITTSILWGFDQKNRFFWGVVLVQV